MNGCKIITLSLAILVLFSVPAHPETVSKMMANTVRSGGDDLNEPVFSNPEKKIDHKKSKFVALGLSLLLPGAGQYYTNSKTKMIIFGSAEAFVWSGFFGLRMYGNWKKDDYMAWAAFHAGADVNGKPEIFYEKMTFYDNLNEYNQLARVIDGSEAYLFPSTPAYYWNWDSDQSRAHFRSLRNQSKNAYRQSLLFAGAAIINRVLAGIDAYRSASAYDRENEFSDAKWRLYYSTNGVAKDGAVEIGIAMRF